MNISNKIFGINNYIKVCPNYEIIQLIKIALYIEKMQIYEMKCLHYNSKLIVKNSLKIKIL